jgi:general secretion pathway protein H
LARRPYSAASRGVTLVEVLITVALIALVMGAATLGLGVTQGARLKRSSVMIVGAVRIAYAHANATSKTVRLVFDFDERVVILEESSDKLMLVKGDKTGGAAAASEAEREAIEAGEKILKGPQPPRPAFEPTTAFGWSPQEGRPGKDLEPGIRFLQVEAGHAEEPENSGRAYLYFWPGGQTERAAIQLVKAKAEGEEVTDEDVMTILISPLTGKAEIKKGKATIPRPRTEEEESEREEAF